MKIARGEQIRRIRFRGRVFADKVVQSSFLRPDQRLVIVRALHFRTAAVAALQKDTEGVLNLSFTQPQKLFLQQILFPCGDDAVCIYNVFAHSLLRYLVLKISAAISA